jgi:hypothetical protein
MPDRYCRNKIDRPSGISASVRESFCQKERGALYSNQFTNLNAPATFGWLDLQEVSQSCPAETLF